MWALEMTQDLEQLREVTEGKESHCKHMLHVLREGHRAGTDHCIIRECNSYTHCPGEEGVCLHLSESTE